MSEADVQRFADEVSKNPTLQEELKGKTEDREILAVAVHHGYHITHEDVLAYADAQNPELNEQDLQRISAGAPFAGNTTRIDPYKNFKF
jgi:predicted ribosomally synthesized peptide with nif11-like leader